MKPSRPTRNHPREYCSWISMIYRCSSPKATRYDRYGGRGITVCERWRNSFEAFLEDMGPRPEGTSIDRHPNPDGNYEKSNCRWATQLEQVRNRSSSVLRPPDFSRIREHAIKLRDLWRIRNRAEKRLAQIINRELAHGEGREFAEMLGISAMFLSDIRVGRRRIGDRLLDRMQAL